jgi:hypothetical protein
VKPFLPVPRVAGCGLALFSTPWGSTSAGGCAGKLFFFHRVRLLFALRALSGRFLHFSLREAFFLPGG